MGSVAVAPVAVPASRPLRTATRIYIASVIGAGGCALAVALGGISHWTPAAPLGLAAIILVSLFKLRLRVGPGRATMTMAQFVDFWMIAVAGANVATAIAAAGVLVQCLTRVRQSQPWYRTAFSVAVIALAVRAAASVWAALGGQAAPDGVSGFIALGGAAIAYFLVNSGLVAWAVASTTGERPVECWRRRFLGAAPASLAAAAAVAMVRQVISSDYASMAVLMLPVGICYAVYARLTNSNA